MVPKKSKLNKSNSSGWLDNYSEESAINKYPGGGKVNDNKGYLISNLDNFTPKKIINSNYITTNNMAFPVEANGVVLYPNTGDYLFPTNKVTETPIMQDGGGVNNDIPKWAYNSDSAEINPEGYPNWWYSTIELNPERKQQHFNAIINQMIDDGHKMEDVPSILNNIVGYGENERNLVQFKPTLGFDKGDLEKLISNYNPNNFKNGGEINNNVMKNKKGGYLKDKNTYVTKDGRETQRGLWANVYLKNHKYQAGGYLDYQDAYKGFGVGPNLTQDNSYYRSIMPTKIENIEGDINKPSVFSGINDVLGKVNQGVNQATSLMSQFSNMSQPPSQIMPDISNWQSPMSARKTDEQLNFENDQALKNAGLFNYYYPTQETTMGPPSAAPSWQGVPYLKNGGYLPKYQDGGMMDMPVGYPEYIHKSNVFQPHEIPVPRVHFSDDTSVFDMGVNLNDLVQMNGGGIGKYQYGGFMTQPRTFNSNSQRANAAQLAAATENDFMRTKMRNDRQQFADNKVDWGFMDWAKEPVGAYFGVMSGVPILGDVSKDVLGDSFLTRTKGYQVGKGVGKTTFGAGKIAGGIATVNPAMIGSGIGDVGSGVGSTYGNLAARDSMSDYDKSGYVSNKRLERASQDFGNMMNTASSLYGNISGGVDMAKNMGGMSGMMNKLKGGKQGMQGFGNIMQMFSGMGGQGGGFDFSQLAGMMGQNGGYVDNYQEGGMVYMPEDLEIPKFKKGGLTPTKARKMLHDKSFTTDKQRKYFGYISSQKKANGGWIDTL
jgi:hypothetical protein